MARVLESEVSLILNYFLPSGLSLVLRKLIQALQNYFKVYDPIIFGFIHQNGVLGIKWKLLYFHHWQLCSKHTSGRWSLATNNQKYVLGIKLYVQEMLHLKVTSRKCIEKSESVVHHTHTLVSNSLNFCLYLFNKQNSISWTYKFNRSIETNRG